VACNEARGAQRDHRALIMGRKRCPHGSQKYQCKECNPCPHGKQKNSCKVCNPCPHGKRKHNCAECKPCPHGKRKRTCAMCTPCPHGKLKSNCATCRRVRRRSNKSPRSSKSRSRFAGTSGLTTAGKTTAADVIPYLAYKTFPCYHDASPTHQRRFHRLVDPVIVCQQRFVLKHGRDGLKRRDGALARTFRELKSN
jgi:hypothetical protein